MPAQDTTSTDLTGVAPLPLTGDRRAAFEAYVATTLAMMGVPGAAVAVVQGGEVVSLAGFGVKELGGTDPVTPDTLMRVASVTKPVTTTMAAALVDDGRVGWDTPVVDLLPDFALADPELTRRLTVADLFCACTGVPPRDAELGFNAFELTPERLIASAATLPLTAPFGEQYQYSNQMFAIGGYAAAAAAGGGPNDLYDAYTLAMRERVLDPIGMERSTFSLADVLADGDYAASHLVNLAGEYHPLALLEDESVFTAEAPAGALWSSAREMARYVQTQLAGGVAPDGTRVVSGGEPGRRPGRRGWRSRPNRAGRRCSTRCSQDYGLGWFVGEYGGQRLLSHGGTAFGFTSEIAFLPEADLGLVVLTNGAADGNGLLLHPGRQVPPPGAAVRPAGGDRPVAAGAPRRRWRPRPPRSWPSSDRSTPPPSRRTWGATRTPPWARSPSRCGGTGCSSTPASSGSSCGPWRERRPPTCSTTARR